MIAVLLDALAHELWLGVSSTGWHTAAHMLNKSCQCNNLGLFMFSHMLFRITSLWRVCMILSRRVTDMDMYVKRFSHRIPFVSPCEASHLLQWGVCIYLT